MIRRLADATTAVLVAAIFAFAAWGAVVAVREYRRPLPAAAEPASVRVERWLYLRMASPIEDKAGRPRRFECREVP